MGKVDTSKYDDAMAGIQKQWGKDTVRRGSDYEHPPRISTGSVLLDANTRGGIHMGRWTRLWGDKGSGKSLFSWQIIKHAQAMGMRCAYHNLEQQYDVEFVESLGVNVDDLTVFETTVIEVVCSNLRQSLGSIHLHVIDSASQGNSLKLMNADDGTFLRGDHTAAWQTGLKKATQFMNEDNAVILIDHVRHDQKNPDLLKPAGGKWLSHQSSLTLQLTPGSWVFYDKSGWLTENDAAAARDTPTGRREKEGYTVSAKVEFSRVCPPGRISEHWIDVGRLKHGQPYDLAFEYQQAMEWLGMVRRSGTWYEVPNYGKVQGKAQLRQLIRGNIPLQEEIKNAYIEEINKPPDQRRKLLKAA